MDIEVVPLASCVQYLIIQYTLNHMQFEEKSIKYSNKPQIKIKPGRTSRLSYLPPIASSHRCIQISNDLSQPVKITRGKPN